MQRVPILCFVALLFVPTGAWAQGEPLGPEFQVNTITEGQQNLPRVAADTAGNFVVVWSSADGWGYGVFGQRFAASGVPLGPEFRINTFTTFVQRRGSAAFDPSGNFVAVWDSEQDGSSYGVFGRRFASSGLPLGGEFRINTHTTDRQRHAAVACDGSGNFVVVWESDSQDGSDDGVFGQRFAASGVPVGPEFRVNTQTTFPQEGAAVASDSSGNFVVTWQSYGQDGPTFSIFGRRFASSGTPVGPEFRVNTYTTSHQDRASVASDPSGNFVVVWSSLGQDGSDRGNFGQRFASSGAPLGPEFRVNTYTTSYQFNARVATDASGNFVVTWNSFQDGSGYGIFGQRYASSGAPLGAEFRVNTYTTTGQSDSSVAADPAGNFVVVWASQGQDGSAFGIFGQRFGPILPVELMHFGVE